MKVLFIGTKIVPGDRGPAQITQMIGVSVPTTLHVVRIHRPDGSCRTVVVVVDRACEYINRTGRRRGDIGQSLIRQGGGQSNAPRRVGHGHNGGTRPIGISLGNRRRYLLTSGVEMLAWFREGRYEHTLIV